MKFYKKGAFTLVELIVVVSILGVLGTIAFLSFGGFLVGARDSTRLSDVTNIKTMVELFTTETGVLPEPSNKIDIVYSGGTVFSQGTFGDSVRRLTDNRITKTPLDPLYKVEYTYSVSSNKRSYNVGFIQEGLTSLNTGIGENMYAETSVREVIGRVGGNYNGQIMHTSTGGIVYIFALPSLIVNKFTNTDILDLTDSFVYDGEANTPESYDGKVGQVGNLKYQPKLVYSGSTLPKTPAQLKDLIVNLQGAFQNVDHPTTLFSHPNFKDLVELDPDNPNELQEYGQKYINSSLGGRFQLKYPKSCKEILGTDDNKGTGLYTISPNGYDKVNVHCDMEDGLDGGGWTRVRMWENGAGYTDIKTVNATRGIVGSEVVAVYTRDGAANAGKKFGIYYDKFHVKQFQRAQTGGGDVLCGEHTTIADLISHLTSGSWGDCSRTGDTTNEFVDIIVDDLGDPAIGDKEWDGFDPDPCITNGHKQTARNVSWTSNGVIQHRIDSRTSLFQLGGTTSPRCDGNSDGSQKILINELYVR